MFNNFYTLGITLLSGLVFSNTAISQITNSFDTSYNLTAQNFTYHGIYDANKDSKISLYEVLTYAYNSFYFTVNSHKFYFKSSERKLFYYPTGSSTPWFQVDVYQNNFSVYISNPTYGDPTNKTKYYWDDTNFNFREANYTPEQPNTSNTTQTAQQPVCTSVKILNTINISSETVTKTCLSEDDIISLKESNIEYFENGIQKYLENNKLKLGRGNLIWTVQNQDCKGQTIVNPRSSNSYVVPFEGKLVTLDRSIQYDANASYMCGAEPKSIHSIYDKDWVVTNQLDPQNLCYGNNIYMTFPVTSAYAYQLTEQQVCN